MTSFVDVFVSCTVLDFHCLFTSLRVLHFIGPLLFIYRLALHFLSEICGLSTKAQDIDMNTPLHIVCAHDHREALNYLLKKEVFSLNREGK